MKKVITIILSFVMMFGVVGVLSGCEDRRFSRVQGDIYQTDYFWFSLGNRNERRIAILLELTELGGKQEVLKVPNYVNGASVIDVGLNIRRQSLSINSQGRLLASYRIRSENLRRIYIPYTVTTLFYIYTPYDLEIIRY